jgi:FkbM family methyltransferase
MPLLQPTQLNASSTSADIMRYWRNCQSLFSPTTFRGHLRLLNQPYVADLSYVGGHRDIPFRFLVTTEVGHQWYATPHAVFAEFAFYDQIGAISRGDIIFDCGAHQGMYSLLFSTMTGASGAVYAFELVPFNAWLSQLNQDINGISNVSVLPIGLSDTDCVIQASPQAHSSLPSDLSDDTQPMTLSTLDSFSSYMPTVVKMDIEGAEIKALQGAQQMLTKRIKWLISLHPPFINSFGDDPNTILQYFPARYFECLIKYPGLQVTNFHGQFPLEDFCEMVFIPR